MKTSLKLVALGSALVFSLVTASSASAQGRPSAADKAARKERAKEHGAIMRQKLESLTPEQKAALKAYREAYKAQKMSVRAQVKAGTLDRKTAAEQLKAWRAANRPPKKP